MGPDCPGELALVLLVAKLQPEPQPVKLLLLICALVGVKRTTAPLGMTVGTGVGVDVGRGVAVGLGAAVGLPFAPWGVGEVVPPVGVGGWVPST